MIELKDGYYIESDAYGYQLVKSYKAKDSKTGELKDAKSTEGYYSSLDKAVNGYFSKVVKDKISTEEKQSLKDILYFIKNMKYCQAFWQVF